MHDDPKEQTMTTKIQAASEDDAPQRVRDAWRELNAAYDGTHAHAAGVAARNLADAYYQWGRDDSDRAAIHAATRPRIAVPNPDAPNVVPPVAYDDQRVIDKWLGVLIVGGTYLVLLLAIVIIAAHRWLW